MFEIHLWNVLWQTYVGDISEADADVIVCAANSLGHMRGGASQAIRLRGGDIIEAEARRLAPIRLGTAVYTTAGNLNAKWVIHAPTIREPVETTTVSRIKAAARAAILLANELGAHGIAFPVLGAGVGEVSSSFAVKALIAGIKTGLVGGVSLRFIKVVVRREQIENEVTGCLDNYAHTAS